LQIALDTGHYEEDGWRVRKDGSYFWASVVIDPILANDGSLIGFAKITRDITERKNAQDEITRVQKQLAEAQKMDALGHLTGGVAHDFNNLLMIITGNLHLLRKEVESEKGLRAFRSIQTATERAGKLTKQLLTFARRQSVRPEAIALAKSLRGLGEVLNSALGANVALRFDICDDVGDIFADPSEFETALLNLVINARDAMPAGGDLTISAKNGKDGQVEISVSDTGLGIPDDIAKKVFDPFFTTKSVGKGTGLGLSQVHGFAHQAGGDVILRSVLNRGTTFTIRLPRSGSCKKAADEAYTSPSSGTVLLVEDHPDVAQATSNLLDLLGYTVRWANSASAALTELRQGGIDIVCSDIVMPGEMDGIELARVIRDSNPSLPILLITGYSKSASDVLQQFPVLRKPYELHELSKALAAIRPH
jgi:signal transduction histidine kinase/CheY-like chemotaxis protein